MGVFSFQEQIDKYDAKKVKSKSDLLSVQKQNYALNMYLAAGFKMIGENKEEYIMVHPLNR